jgi:hypothetical protein
MEQAVGIYESLLQGFGNALKEEIPTSKAAGDMARRRISEECQLRDASLTRPFFSDLRLH